MRFSSLLALAGALPAVVNAAPVLQPPQPTDSDALVLSELFPSLISTTHSHSPPEFAVVLNQLELSFYTQALAKFNDSDFSAAGFTMSDIPKEAFKYASFFPSFLPSDHRSISTGKFNLTNRHTSTCTSSSTVAHLTSPLTCLQSHRRLEEQERCPTLRLQFRLQLRIDRREDHVSLCPSCGASRCIRFL
jgi:hypothetical protein